MSDQSMSLDANQIAAALVSSAVESLVSSCSNYAKHSVEKLRIKIGTAFTRYLEKLHQEHAKCHSFLIRDHPVSLYDFYVAAGICSGSVRMPAIFASDLERFGNSLIICGQAGCGKSMLSRHLLLNSMKHGKLVPIYCELRNINGKVQSVYDLISEIIEERGLRVGKMPIHDILSCGKFLIIFDGYDELVGDLRKSVGEQIRSFPLKYPNSFTLLTSRPDPEFSGWQGFARADVLPLSLDQCCELVKKMPFDGKIKTKFLGDLRSELFENHRSFLSNPLLLTIMVLTYDENAEIPSKLSIFYNQAFEALYARHDARKVGYQRPKKSNLDIHDFAKVLSAFCLLTFDKRLFRFSEAEALAFLADCRSITEIMFKADDYLQDLLRAVNILVEDGLFLTFSHRSFQEYFTARFISESPHDRKEELINRYTFSMGRDNVLSLLFEIDPYPVEKVVILPKTQALLDRSGFKKKATHKSYVRYIKAIYTDFGLRDDGVVAYHRKTPADDGWYFDIICLLRRTTKGWPNYHEHTETSKKLRQVVAVLVGDLPEKRISVEAIADNDPFFKVLAASDTFWGFASYVKLIEMFQTLKLRHQNRCESIDRILGLAK